MCLVWCCGDEWRKSPAGGNSVEWPCDVGMMTIKWREKLNFTDFRISASWGEMWTGDMGGLINGIPR